jgi:hypothetical protein
VYLHVLGFERSVNQDGTGVGTGVVNVPDLNHGAGVQVIVWATNGGQDLTFTFYLNPGRQGIRLKLPDGTDSVERLSAVARPHVDPPPPPPPAPVLDPKDPGNSKAWKDRAHLRDAFEPNGLPCPGSDCSLTNDRTAAESAALIWKAWRDTATRMGLPQPTTLEDLVRLYDKDELANTGRNSSPIDYPAK